MKDLTAPDRNGCAALRHQTGAQIALVADRPSADNSHTRIATADLL